MCDKLAEEKWEDSEMYPGEELAPYFPEDDFDGGEKW